MRKPRGSTAMINRKGDRGSPCWSPFHKENSYAGQPLIRILTLAFEIQDYILYLHFNPKPIQATVKSTCLQETESTAFSKSILKTKQPCPHFCESRLILKQWESNQGFVCLHWRRSDFCWWLKERLSIYTISKTDRPVVISLRGPWCFWDEGKKRSMWRS